MARPVRVDVADGWYHITARGTERRDIFTEDRERQHFLELLGRLVHRYGVWVHAYVLMENHYHLLIQTPEANASSAMQWLQVSYSMWFNKRHGRVGPLFQGRFQSVPVDGGGSWALMASVYLHLNPVRVRELGLGKRDRKAEGHGVRSAPEETIRARLRRLRGYRWSSYGAYAGYTQAPEWLSRGEILRRGGGQKAYRRYVVEWVTQGREPEEFVDARERWALGTEAFLEQLRRSVKKLCAEQPDRRHLARLVSVSRITAVVESETGRKWESFADEYGDSGRDLVLYLARQLSGLTLREIGEAAGGMGYKATSSAVARFSVRLDEDAACRRLTQRCLRQLQNKET
jgi:REP element-mobilizing transposase RayT